ncbi:TraR/DksA C4-type zinc finger protein [Evansella clarkii]|uniref:TraR/DksA C4-type zinc finger protein n=1 Tax=Evansella clarkii TaxID=79879 RepID=UPI0009980DCA|nr:TraR/DksA C4-type zinc finger protein [Evansella clarkii]
MLSEEQIQTLRQVLTEEKESLEKRLKDHHYGLDLEHATESMDELSRYDNHPGDLGTELYEREKDLALDEHSEYTLKEIDLALNAIAEETYGKCEKCGDLIPYERLEAVPTTRRCVKHAEDNTVSNTRPVEEDVLKPAFGKFEYDESNEQQTFFDAEDSWQTVAKFGTSETPSDFSDTDKDYNAMYVEGEEDTEVPEEIEDILTADIEGKFSGVSVDHHKYEKYLDENDVDTIMDRDES